MSVRSIEAPASHKVVIMLSHEEYLELRAQAEEQQRSVKGQAKYSVLKSSGQAAMSRRTNRILDLTPARKGGAR